jgi:hypothetical protein
MSCQRTKYRNSNLSQERTDLLNAIGIDWGIINKEEQWQKMYQELKEFKDANGHCNVPDSYSLNVPLDRWVQHQRHTYKSGKLSDERKGLLLELGFLFEPQSEYICLGNLLFTYFVLNISMACQQQMTSGV